MSRVTTHFSHLPIEIYDQIIGMNHDDYQTLANCSLVCRAWSPTCRMHRFRELKVMPRPVGRPLAASLLCDLTSTVLPYVRNLVLVEGLPEMDLDREDRDTITLDPSVGGTTYWFDDVLPEVRTRDLTALESLSLQALQWESLSSSSRSSTVELCRRLRSLDVITWDPLDIPHTAVIQFLSAATALERFTLHLPEQGIIPPINLDELPPPSGADATLALQVFEVHNAVCWYIQTLPRHFSTLHITEATLRGVGRNHVEALIVFLTLCAPTLHRLSLQLEDPYPIWGEVEDTFVAQGGLSSATSLRSLTLDARLVYTPPIVQQITSPHLTDLNLKINMAMFANRHALDKDQGRDGLVQSLTTGLFSTIRPRVSILLLPKSDWPAQENASQLSSARDVLLADFVSLRDEGRLRIMRCVVDSKTHEEVVDEF